ncbi:hypothetical protein H9L39_19326 [Fusarium oxysporum f. sp. albedinis]|nr:hypothetical protein H9L39_19326 [Fusarium oxysporum f. sp. albedinis]
MGGLKTESFDDMYERVGGLLAKQQESGPTGFKHQLAEPRADLWVSQNIAAVFVGWSASMDGRSEFIHTVHLCTLHRQSDDILSDGNPWRISALVDMKHLLPEQPVPSVETGPVSEIIAPFQEFLKSIKAQDWGAIPALSCCCLVQGLRYRQMVMHRRHSCGQNSLSTYSNKLRMNLQLRSGFLIARHGVAAIWALSGHRSCFRLAVLKFPMESVSAPLGWRADDGLLVVFARRAILSEHIVTVITRELAFNDA